MFDNSCWLFYWLVVLLFILFIPPIVLGICLLCWTWWIPFYISCVILSSDENYSVLCSHGKHCLSSSAVFSISLRISWSVGLVLKNCLSLCLYWIVFISLSVLKDGLLYVENLVDNFILFSVSNISWHVSMTFRSAKETCLLLLFCISTLNNVFF